MSNLNQENLKKHLMQSNFFTARDNDETSSHMFSQAGSPFRKARRTREERRKTTKDLNTSTFDSVMGDHLEDDSMLNISPMKKSKTNNNMLTALAILQTPARQDDIDEFLMTENLVLTAAKNSEGGIMKEDAPIIIVGSGNN